MQCSELEKYLECYLDGRLGRSRAAILRRHMSACDGCRVRFASLRKFEQDLNRRLRAMSDATSLWAGLDAELVRSGQLGLPARREQTSVRLLPPPEPAIDVTPPAPQRLTGPRPSAFRRRAMVSGVAGMVIIGIAVAGVAEMAWSWISPSASNDDAAISSYLAYVKGSKEVDFMTADPASLQNWFATSLGVDFPMPPMPADTELQGGRLAHVAGQTTAVIVYASEGEPTLLFMTPHGPGLDTGDKVVASTAAVATINDTVNELSWTAGGFDYTLVSRMALDDMHGFSTH